MTVMVYYCSTKFLHIVHFSINTKKKKKRSDSRTLAAMEEGVVCSPMSERRHSVQSSNGVTFPPPVISIVTKDWRDTTIQGRDSLTCYNERQETQSSNKVQMTVERREVEVSAGSEASHCSYQTDV